MADREILNLHSKKDSLWIKFEPYDFASEVWNKHSFQPEGKKEVIFWSQYHFKYLQGVSFHVIAPPLYFTVHLL